MIIVPDQPMKRLQYEANVIKTFYLSNLIAADVQNSLAMMVRTQYKAPSIIVDKNLNSLTIRDTPNGVRLAEKLIRTWDKSARRGHRRPRDHRRSPGSSLKKLGLDLGDVGSNALGLRYSGGDTTPESGWLGLNGLNFSKAGNFQISLPTAYLQMIASDSETRIIAQPRLRRGRLGRDQVPRRAEGSRSPDDLHALRRRRHQPAAGRQLRLQGCRDRRQNEAPHPPRKRGDSGNRDQDHLPRRDGDR